MANALLCNLQTAYSLLSCPVIPLYNGRVALTTIPFPTCRYHYTYCRMLDVLICARICYYDADGSATDAMTT